MPQVGVVEPIAVAIQTAQVFQSFLDRRLLGWITEKQQAVTTIVDVSPVRGETPVGVHSGPVQPQVGVVLEYPVADQTLTSAGRSRRQVSAFQKDSAQTVARERCRARSADDSATDDNRVSGRRGGLSVDRLVRFP